MASRRGKLGAAPKGQPGAAAGRAGTGVASQVSAEPPGGLEDERQAPAVLTIEDVVHTEHDRARHHDDLLETVSPAALQTHPSAPLPPPEALHPPDPLHVPEPQHLPAPQHVPAPLHASVHSHSSESSRPAAPVHSESQPGSEAPAQAAQSPSASQVEPFQATPAAPAASRPSLVPLGPFWLPRAAARVNLTLWSHLQTEALSAVAHLGALSTARTPADLMALQARELQRALRSTLDLGREIAEGASQTTSP